MFFKANKAPKGKEITDKKSASIALNEIVKKDFEKMRDEMIKVLVELNIPQEDYDEYIDDLYQKVQAQAMILLNKGLKEKMTELKNQSNSLEHR